MSWKLISFIISLVITILFIGANLGNACSINLFWLKEIPNVPVYLTILISFGIGVLVAIPFFIFRISSRSSTKNSDSQKKTVHPQKSPDSKTQGQKKSPTIIYGQNAKKGSDDENE